jgi:uncharacterized membrane protein
VRHTDIARTITAVLALVLLLALAVVVPWVVTVTAWGIATLIVCLFAAVNARRTKP